MFTSNVSVDIRTAIRVNAINQGLGLQMAAIFLREFVPEFRLVSPSGEAVEQCFITFYYTNAL